MKARGPARGDWTRWSWTAILLAVALLPACVCAAAPATSAAPVPAHLRVVADNNYPPFLFLDANGKPTGYEVDMWRLFAEHTGIKVDLEPMQWSQAQKEILSGHADVIDMIYRTPARERLYDFSPPYASHNVSIYVSRDIRGVHSVAALRGFPVGVEVGDACVDKLQAAGIGNLYVYPNYTDVIQAAVRGDVRIFCMDEDPANYYLYKYSALDQFAPAFVLYRGELQRAVRKGDGTTLLAVEHGMAQITPAELATLHARWLEQPLVLQPYIRVAKIALAAILIVIALMVAWVWMLRRGIARGTRELDDERRNLKALFDASPDGMWVKDHAGVHQACNERALELLQVERPNFVGHTDAEVFDAAHADRIRVIDEKVMRTGRANTSVVAIPAADGATRQVEIIKVSLRAADGTARGVLSVARDLTERLQTEARLRLWAHAFQHAGFGVEICDVRARTITAVNPVFAREHGYTPEEMVGMPVEAVYPDAQTAERAIALGIGSHTGHVLIESEHVTRDGRRFPVLLDCSVSYDADGVAEHALIYLQDITDRKRADAELRLAAVAFEAQEALVVMDADGLVQRVNAAFSALTGYTPEEIVGQSPALLNAHRHGQLSADELHAVVREEGFWEGERWIRGKHGAPKVVRTKISAVRDQRGELIHLVGTMVDLTGEREAHASLDRMTFFDPLTDLPNREFLLGQLQHVLDEPGSGGALLLIDLDHFKHVNDLRGHAAGDRLLVLIAQRLRPWVQDDWQLSRFSGGTFALLATCEGNARATKLDCAQRCAERIRDGLREPFHLGDNVPVAVTASIGWTEVTPGRDSAESVLKQAELAMYSAKACGRDQVCRFEAAMQVELVHHEQLVADLRRAIADEAFDVYLQPQSDRRGRVVGAEALLRWTRSGGERVSPGLFVPIAEENGLIVPLGGWVLRRSCAQLVAWSTRPATSDLTLAVNVSARQFVRPEFVAEVRRALADTGANPERLKLEITESTVLGDLGEAAGKLSRLRALGIRISLDDFGTGYSSLSYLSRLPMDQLKIDQSFVARLPDSLNDAMVVETIIGMGRGLGLEVIAEGVETQAQWNFLVDHGCELFQGFLIARPMPHSAFEALLDAQVAPT